MSFLFEYFPCKVTQSEDGGKMNNDVMSPRYVRHTKRPGNGRKCGTTEYTLSLHYAAQLLIFSQHQERVQCTTQWVTQRGHMVGLN